MVLHTAQTTEWCTWWWCHTDTLEHLEKEVGFGVLDDVHSESIADIIALVSTFSLCRLLWSIQFSSVSFSNSVLKISFPCNLTLASRCSFPLFLSYSVLPLPFSLLQLSSVQSLSRVRLFVTPWTAACQASLSITNSRSLLKHILSQWCHPTISSSVVPFSSCFQSFPTSGSFQMSQIFTSGGQSIGVATSTSDLPMNTQDWSPLGWTGWISLQSRGLSRVFSNTTVQKHQFFGTLLSL